MRFSETFEGIALSAGAAISNDERTTWRESMIEARDATSRLLNSVEGARKEIESQTGIQQHLDVANHQLTFVLADIEETTKALLESYDKLLRILAKRQPKQQTLPKLRHGHRRKREE